MSILQLCSPSVLCWLFWVFTSCGFLDSIPVCVHVGWGVCSLPKYPARQFSDTSRVSEDMTQFLLSARRAPDPQSRAPSYRTFLYSPPPNASGKPQAADPPATDGRFQVFLGSLIQGGLPAHWVRPQPGRELLTPTEKEFTNRLDECR